MGPRLNAQEWAGCIFIAIVFAAGVIIGVFAEAMLS